MTSSPFFYQHFSDCNEIITTTIITQVKKVFLNYLLPAPPQSSCIKSLLTVAYHFVTASVVSCTNCILKSLLLPAALSRIMNIEMPCQPNNDGLAYLLRQWGSVQHVSLWMSFVKRLYMWKYDELSFDHVTQCFYASYEKNILDTSICKVYLHCHHEFASHVSNQLERNIRNMLLFKMNYLNILVSYVWFWDIFVSRKIHSKL